MTLIIAIALPLAAQTPLIDQGRALFEKRDFEHAAEVFEKAVAATPNNAEAHYLLGATYADGAGIEHQVLLAGQPFAARYEQGRWSAEQFRTGSTGQG